MCMRDLALTKQFYTRRTENSENMNFNKIPGQELQFDL